MRLFFFFFFFKQKTAYELRISDWSSDVCSSDLPNALVEGRDYEEIPNGEPWMPLNGKVEVVEVFGYVCPACARIEPLFSSWEEKIGRASCRERVCPYV